MSTYEGKKYTLKLEIEALSRQDLVSAFVDALGDVNMYEEIIRDTGIRMENTHTPGCKQLVKIEVTPLEVKEEEPVNPWKGLKKKIEDAEKKPCLACGSEEDIEASHNCHPLDGGDLAAEILIVPLCKICRRKWFLDREFRKVLIRDHPEQLDVVSF